jgi:hypothetical protein
VSAFTQRAGQPFTHVISDVADDHMRAFRDKAPHDRLANASRCAGDQCDFIR